MVKVNGLVCDLVTNEFFGIDVLEHEFDLELDSDEVYSIGVDQSTSNTGIFIKDENGKCAIILEVANYGEERFGLILKNFIKRLVRGKKIRYLIFENPLNFISGRSNRKLLELKRDLKDIKSECSDLRETTVAFEFPQNWRSGLIPPNCGYDRRSKDTVVLCVCNTYPLLENFLNRTGTDMDGFEACGILLGYFGRRGLDNNGDGVELIVGEVNTRKKAVMFCKYLDDNFDTEIEQFQKIFGTCKVKEYNHEFNFYSNVKMSLVDDLSVFFCHPFQALQLCNLFDMDCKQEETMVVLVAPLKSVDEMFLLYLEQHGYQSHIYE